MPDTSDITRRLRRELDDARRRLAEAEETLDAIRNGEVDGLVVAGSEGQQVFTLQGAQEPYRLLIEQMSEGALTLSRDGVILYANQPFARMLQLPVGRIIGVALRDFVAPADHPALANLLLTAMGGRTSEEVSVRTADGAVVLLRLGLSRLQLGVDSLLCAVATDITVERKDEVNLRHRSDDLEARIAERTTDLSASRLAVMSMMEEEVASRQALETANRNLTREIAERKHAEVAERESEKRFRALFDNMLNGFAYCRMIYERDEPRDCVYLATNAAFETLTGLRNVVGRKISEVIPGHLESDPELIARYGRVARTGVPERFEFHSKAMNMWFDLTVYCPEPDHFVAVFDVITERKKADAAMRESARELQEKNAELERFLYTASHDLKSPIVTVRTFFGYLEKDIATGDAGRLTKDMDFIRTATDKMAQLLDDFLEISRVGRVIKEPVNVMFHALVDDALGAVAGRIAQRGVTVAVSDQDVTVFVDRARVAEVFQNLLDNACKFMGDQPVPRIEVGVEERNGETVFFVRDNGIGIDPRHQSKVFGLFEKLDPKAEGTGIGLALVRRIIELNRGRIWVESKGVGQGACFYFTLPGAVGSRRSEDGSRRSEDGGRRTEDGGQRTEEGGEQA